MEYVSTIFNQFNKIHPLLKVGIGAASALALRHVGSKISRLIYNLPNGPEGYPILGIIPYMLLSSSPLNLFAYTLSSYGPITCFSLGLSKVILINDPYLAKKIYANPLTLDKQERGKTDANPLGLLNGQKWKKRRKVLYLNILSSLKTSFVEQGTKKYFKEIIAPIIDECGNNKNELNLKYVLKPLAFNIIFYSMFGIYLKSLDDSFWINFNLKTNNHTKNTVLRMIKSTIYGENKWIDHEWNDILKFLEEYVDKNVDPQNNKECIYYKLLSEKDKNNMRKIDIISEILGLFIGATEATSTTMHFVILLLAKYPKIQNKIYKELKSMQCNDVGIELNANNLTKLPNFRALIHETLRLYPVTIGTAPRSIKKSFIVENVKSTCGKIKNYKIPKGCLMQINTIGIARNQKYWTDKQDDINMDEPHLEFWMNKEKTKFVLNKDAFTTFSIGKRDCVGRALAIKQIYIIMSCLILKYKFYVKDVENFKINGKLARGPLIPQSSQPIFVEKRVS